jgi:Flp pilus assembly protein TadG
MQAWRRLRHDESGMSYAFVGMGLAAFLSASMLAIDVGMLMTARNQAQNAADAGALAGATALFYDDFDDRSADGPAVTSAIAAAKANTVMSGLDARDGGGGVVDVTPADVEFLNDEIGQPTRVKVTVHRTAERGNPVSTLIAGIIGRITGNSDLESASIRATATAEVSPANGMTCVKPFTIPDKWREMNDAPWTVDDEYDAFTKGGNPQPLPSCVSPAPGCADVYIPAANCPTCPQNPDYTGYNNERERGTRLTIRAATGNNITVSFYFSLSIGGMEGTGGDPYRWNIANCNRTIMHWYEPLIQEPGAMDGPTIQGLEDLIARDPNAIWDEDANDVRNSSADGQSPRVFPIPLYDPEYYDAGKRNGRMADLRVANWIGFFLERIENGNGAVGRIIPIGGIRDRTYTGPTNLFPRAIRLVQ